MRLVRSRFFSYSGCRPRRLRRPVRSVRGIIHDPQHRPVQNAMVMIKAKTSDWAATANSNANGEFAFAPVPLGEYVVTVAGPGFDQSHQDVTVISGSYPVLHIALAIAGAKETVDVSGAARLRPQQFLHADHTRQPPRNRRTPGADRTNSLAMITDFVPGAYMTHDQLHIRGGHQVSWLLDGIPVPNTNIASNIGPQIDPKDIDYLEVSRGSYGAELGDRTYGAFNVVPRTGFERNHEGELVLERRKFLPDQRPVQHRQPHRALRLLRQRQRQSQQLRHPDSYPASRPRRRKRYGGFGSLIFNADPTEPTPLRNFSPQGLLPDPLRSEFQRPRKLAVRQQRHYATADHESDAILNFSWVHTFNSRLMLTVSPFYHYNSANYHSSPSDYPTATTDRHSSTYAGGQVSFSADLAKQQSADRLLRIPPARQSEPRHRLELRDERRSVLLSAPCNPGLRHLADRHPHRRPRRLLRR